MIGLGSAMQLAGGMPYGADYVAVALIIAALATDLAACTARGRG